MMTTRGLAHVSALASGAPIIGMTRNATTPRTVDTLFIEIAPFGDRGLPKGRRITTGAKKILRSARRADDHERRPVERVRVARIAAQRERRVADRRGRRTARQEVAMEVDHQIRGRLRGNAPLADDSRARSRDQQR